MDIDYSFPTSTSPHFKYDHDVTLSEFDSGRIVTTGVFAKKVDNPAAPTPFYEILIKYDYSDAGDASVLGPLVVTTDEGAPITVDWGVNPPGPEMVQKCREQGTKIPNHSMKLDLTGDTGEKIRNVFTAVKAACVELLVSNTKSIGSHGSNALMSGDPANYFKAILKAHDMARHKLPNGDFEMVPAKFLNLVGFSNTDKATNKQKHVIKTHFYAPNGAGDGQLDIHVSKVVKKKITIHPSIYFQRIYCGANLSIQSFLDSAMVLEIDNPMSRQLTSSAKRRLAAYNSGSSDKFRAMCQQITSPAHSDTASVQDQDLPGDAPHHDEVPAPPGDGTAGLFLEDGDEFDKSLAAVTVKADAAPKRSFRRVVS